MQKRSILCATILLMVGVIAGCQSKESESPSSQPNSLSVAVAADSMSPNSVANKETETPQTNKSDISTEGFWDAVQSGNIDSVAAYIDQGVDVNIQDQEGIAAIIIAAINNDYKIIDLLLEHGADVDVKTKDGATALSFAAMEGSELVAEKLIEHGANVNEQENSKGDTPIMLAIKESHSDIVKLLYKQDIDLQIRNNEGNTAIEMAIALNNPDINEFLRLDEVNAEPTYYTMDYLESGPSSIFSSDIPQVEYDVDSGEFVASSDSGNFNAGPDQYYEWMIGKWKGTNGVGEEITFEFLPDKSFLSRSVTDNVQVVGYYFLSESDPGLTEMYTGEYEKMFLGARKIMMPDADTLCLTDLLGNTKRLIRVK